MRLELILPRVKPDEFEQQLVCPHEGCQGRHFEHHQEVDKPLKDTRYRTMRGYKRRKSAVNVSRLLAWCGNHLGRGGAALALLVA